MLQLIDNIWTWFYSYNYQTVITKMADLSGILKRIKNGEVDDLLKDIKTCLTSSSGTVESQQLIRHCSRYVYERPNITQVVFSQLVEIVHECCKYHHGQSLSDVSFHIKSMYYIILIASKRKEFHQHLCGLLNDVHPYVELCDATEGDMHTILNNLYQCVWNASLSVKISVLALTFQQHALLFFLASGANIVKVCDLAVKILFNYEYTNKSLENTQGFCFVIISKVMRTLKKNTSFNKEIVLSVINLLLQYAKTLSVNGKCGEYSKMTRPIVDIFESGCDQETVMSLKIGLKLSEVGMALKVGKCKEDMLIKFLQSSSMAPSTVLSNNIMLLCLLGITELFETQQKKEMVYTLNPQVLDIIINDILGRCTSQLPDEIYKKVATILSLHLGGYLEKLKNSKDQISIMKEALPWVLKTSSYIITYCNGKPEMMCQIYNVGVNAGNLGVLSFRANNYDVSADFLESSVAMLSMYLALAPADQNQSASSSLQKKFVLWSDALRYNGNHWEAALAACRGTLLGHISQEDLVVMWVKCKRDAEKLENKRLRGLTICDVVRDAQTKCKEPVVIKFNTFVALQNENINYRKQNHDTSEDQLSCGRAMLACAEHVEDKIQGFLVMAEALWMEPSLVSHKDEALETVKKAITLVAETKSKATYTPKLQEIEALSYFWMYLCHLQQIQNAATEDFQESGKPISLTLQATDLGEEVQVDDSCDVRPSSTCLTLYAQETCLASLYVALTLWEDLNAKGVILDNVSLCLTSLASTGYVYQLSGLVNPTVRTWATLVSLARKHSDTIYFVRGVTELLFMIPELVPWELVKEANEKAVVLQEEKSQESSSLYVSLSLSAAISYYHLKKGQYKEGALYLKQALSNEVMEKRTTRATELQAIINYIASLYSWLPPWIVKSNRPSQPSVALALLACRQAMAVLKSSVSTSNDILCWRHRVGWLHITTTLWLGHVCHASAQPRLARAYLKQSLTLTQELALPLRTGELLELLARVDLLCGQLEDCMVKVDSILGLLVAHPSNPDIFTKTRNAGALVDSPVNTKDGNDSRALPIFSNTENNEEESMRTSSSFEFDLKYININSGLLVVGAPERVSQFTTMQAPSSPSLGYREKVTLVNVEPCPHGCIECSMCSTPAVHQMQMAATVLLAYVHAHKGHSLAAKKSLDKFKEMYASICDKAPHICSHLISYMDKKWKKDLDSSSRYIFSKLNLIHLQSLHCQAEILALNCNFEKAFHVSVEALKTIQSIDRQILLQDMNFVTIIMIQMKALKKALYHIKRERKSAGKVTPEILVSESDDEVAILPCKTPAKFWRRTDRNTSIRTSHRILKVMNAPVKGSCFDIFSDHEDSDDERQSEGFLKIPSADYTKKYSKTGKKLASKSSVSFVSPSKQCHNVKSVGNQLGKVNLDTSPCRSILITPNSFSVSPHISSSVSKSPSKGIENVYNDDSKRIINDKSSTKSLPKSCIERKQRVVRKTEVEVDSSVSIFCDKDSPDSIFSCVDEESIPTRGRRKKVNEEKIGKETKKSTNSRGYALGDASTRPKTRSSRTIR